MFSKKIEIKCTECGKMTNKTQEELSEGNTLCNKCEPQSESLVEIND